MTRAELAILALLGFGIWLGGAVTFRLGGGVLFDSGPWVLAASAVAIAITVCLLLRSIMNWRKAPAAQAVTVAVAMALPGLFGCAAYTLAFTQVTGLASTNAGPYAAVMLFGNATLLAYSLWIQASAEA